jgi:bifunctional non-homologous end joining protein LigD
MTAIAACLASAAGRPEYIPARGSTGPDKFPEIVAEAAKLQCDTALLDGRIVSLDDRGATNFSALQQAISEGGRGLSLFLFDALEVNGEIWHPCRTWSARPGWRHCSATDFHP